MERQQPTRQDIQYDGLHHRRPDDRNGKQPLDRKAKGPAGPIYHGGQGALQPLRQHGQQLQRGNTVPSQKKRTEKNRQQQENQRPQAGGSPGGKTGIVFCGRSFHAYYPDYLKEE